MAFGRIPLNFDAMSQAYKFWNALDDGTPVGTEVSTWIKKQTDYEKLHQLKLSTTCCMQASMGFNVTARRIPQAGAGTRNNTQGEQTGLYYILTVSEFRAWLTFTFGPTDQVRSKGDIPNYCPGVLIFGDAHIEFWDGDDVLQASVMSDSFLWGQPKRPMWFWYLSIVAPGSDEVLPDWLVGWWQVYDGDYYYYYFNPSGVVIYIETRPNPKWTPPAGVGNRGQASMGDHGPVISWQSVGGLQPTVETFTQLNWSSQTDMNGTSSAYGQLYARKMAF